MYASRRVLKPYCVMKVINGSPLSKDAPLTDHEPLVKDLS
jgi:hypothetical protein